MLESLRIESLVTMEQQCDSAVTVSIRQESWVTMFLQRVSSLLQHIRLTSKLK
jgi:hypothetical protein